MSNQFLHLSWKSPQGQGHVVYILHPRTQYKLEANLIGSLLSHFLINVPSALRRKNHIIRKLVHIRDLGKLKNVKPSISVLGSIHSKPYLTPCSFSFPASIVVDRERSQFPTWETNAYFGFITEPLFYPFLLPSHTSLGRKNGEEASGFHEAEARKFCGCTQQSYSLLQLFENHYNA